MTNGSGALYEILDAFRRTHAVRRHVIAGHTWDVIEAGSGARTVVLMPSGGTSAESEFSLIVALEPNTRVLSIGCPPTLRTMRDAVEGLKALLDRYDVQSCCLLGHSLGGILAQCFALTFPDGVDGLILANVANYSRLRAKVIKAVVSSARFLPRKALIRLLSARINSLLRGHADREFWLAYFTGDELARAGSEGIVNRGACIEDATEHWTSVAKPIKPWNGPILILESDNETGFTAAERKAFRDHYAHAKVQTFYGAGHLSNLTRMEEFNTAVLDFLGHRGGQEAGSA